MAKLRQSIGCPREVEMMGAAASSSKFKESAAMTDRNAKDASPRTGLYVQYGCGVCAPEAWVNFDASPRLRLERLPVLGGIVRATVGKLFPVTVRFGDIVKGLPLRDSSAAAIYCSHVLEHLARDEITIALRNTLRILVPGGIFRLVVPDLHWRVCRYLAAAEANDPRAADELIDGCYLGVRRGPKAFIDIAKGIWGRSRHLWMYDFASLKLLLEDAGFVAIRRCDHGDSADPMFAMVEDESRFVDNSRRELAIEARRPPPPRNKTAISP
ncbi:MAG: methyltransferase domain-containing protein [Xanthobacteraceae bacterium]